MIRYVVELAPGVWLTQQGRGSDINCARLFDSEFGGECAIISHQTLPVFSGPYGMAARVVKVRVTVEEVA